MHFNGLIYNTPFFDKFLYYFDGFFHEFFRGLKFFYRSKGSCRGYLGEGFSLSKSGELDKEGLEKVVYFPYEVIDEVESVSCKSSKREEWVIGYMLGRESLTYSQEVNNEGGIYSVSFMYITDGFSESIQLR